MPVILASFHYLYVFGTSQRNIDIGKIGLRFFFLFTSVFIKLFCLKPSIKML